MLKNFFKKKKEINEDNLILIPALLIHAAKIDENYSEPEKKIILKALSLVFSRICKKSLSNISTLI